MAGTLFCPVARHVVIAGGGFGGFYAARSLVERLLPAQSATVTLVNDVNFMLYTPLLSGVARRRWTRVTWSCRCDQSSSERSSSSVP